jgi:hypothetical protein
MVFVKTAVTPAVVAVTEMTRTLSYIHDVFCNEEIGYVKLSFVLRNVSTVLVNTTN